MASVITIPRIKRVHHRAQWNPQAPLAHGCIGFWRAWPHSAGGDQWRDWSPYRNHCDLIGMDATNWVVTDLGPALYFDGTSGHRGNIPHNARYNVTEYAHGVGYASTTSGANRRAVNKPSGQAWKPTFALMIGNANDQYGGTFHSTGGQYPGVSNTVAVNDGSLHVGSDSITSNGTSIKSWTDGVYLGEDTSWSGTPVTNTNPIVIGAQTTNGNAERWLGEIVWFGLWNQSRHDHAWHAYLNIQAKRNFPDLFRKSPHRVFFFASGAATYNEALTLAIDAGHTMAADSTAEGQLTLSQILTQSLTGEAQAEGALTLASVLTQALVADSTAEGALTLASVLTQALTADAQAEGQLTLSQILTQALTGEATVEGALTLSGTHGQSVAGGLVLDSSLILAIDLAQAIAGGLQLDSSLTLAIDAGHTMAAGAQAEGALSLAYVLQVAAVAGAVAEALQTLSTTQAQSPAADSTAEASLTLSQVLSQSLSGGLSLDSFLTLAIDAGHTLSSTRSIEAALTLAVDYGLAQTTSLDAEAALTLSHVAAHTLALQALAEAGLTLSHIHTQVKASQLITTATAPDERTYIVTVDTRTLAVEVSSRTYIVPVDTRTLDT